MYKTFDRLLVMYVPHVQFGLRSSSVVCTPDCHSDPALNKSTTRHITHILCRKYGYMQTE